MLPSRDMLAHWGTGKIRDGPLELDLEVDPFVWKSKKSKKLLVTFDIIIK